MIKDCCCCGSKFHIDLDGVMDKYTREAAEAKTYDDWCDRHQKCLQIEQSIMLIKHSLLLEKTKIKETYSGKPKTSGSSTSGLN